jgi:prepilin-type N-terminal cleavage/methylation domain-containing protein
MPRILRKSRGFTMIELLVTIGIIALLAGILIYALKHITGQSKTQATKVALENLKSMLGEFETQGGFSREPPFWTWQYAGPVIQKGTPNVAFWKTPGPPQAAPDREA